jgi:hypothetical protein
VRVLYMKHKGEDFLCLWHENVCTGSQRRGRLSRAGYVALFASASCFALLRHRPSVVTDRKHSETAAIVSNRCIFVVNVY